PSATAQIYTLSLHDALPISFKCKLLGIQIVPPDLAVDPPNTSVFSRTIVDKPFNSAVSPAVKPPAPEPTTTTSNSSSQLIDMYTHSFYFLKIKNNQVIHLL